MRNLSSIAAYLKLQATDSALFVQYISEEKKIASKLIELLLKA